MVEPEHDDPTGDLLAGELAIGLLEGEARRDAVRRQLSDPDFAAKVEAWQLRLGPLLSAIAPVEAPPRVWRSILRRLPAHADTTGTVAGASPAALRRWQVATAISGLAAALFAGLFFLTPQPEPRVVTRTVAKPQVIQAATARLGDGESGPDFAARYDPLTDRLRVQSSDVVAKGSLVPELWVIPKDGKPRSLGLLPQGPRAEVAVPGELRAYLRPGSTLAVSLEQADGAPHAAPAGDIIATGAIFEI